MSNSNVNDQVVIVPSPPSSTSGNGTQSSRTLNGFDVDLEKGDLSCQQLSPPAIRPKTSILGLAAHRGRAGPTKLCFDRALSVEAAMGSSRLPTPMPLSAHSQVCWLADGRGAKLIQGHLDTIVIIAALLLAVNAAFVLEGLKLLEPDNQELATKLLRSLILMGQANSTTKLSDLLHLEPFVPNPCVLEANRYMVASLCLCLAAVCGAVAGKDATLHGVHKTRCDQEELGRFGVRILLTVLHQLIFAAVVTFFVGFIKQAAYINESIRNLALVFAFVSLLLYLAPGFIFGSSRILRAVRHGRN